MAYTNKVVQCYTYLGVIPFIIAAALSLCDMSTLPYLPPVDMLFKAYAISIACFMNGTHWGIVMRPPIANTWVMTTSIVSTLILWGSWFLIDSQWLYCLLFLIYGQLYIVDLMLMKMNYEEPLYLRLRFRVTMIVMFCILVVYSNLLMH
jgi:hypothetical protein